MELKELILKRIEKFYSSKQKALDWYITPNRYFTVDNIEVASPQEMVERGKGDRVLNWIEIAIGV
jgi:hypothetical protein